ncbi:hypothetical protein MBLNU459_g5291t1 [Dothideomycetes sp. NU459]
MSTSDSLEEAINSLNGCVFEKIINIIEANREKKDAIIELVHETFTKLPNLVRLYADSSVHLGSDAGVNHHSMPLEPFGTANSVNLMNMTEFPLADIDLTPPLSYLENRFDILNIKTPMELC